MTVAAKVPAALVDRLDAVAEKREWSRSEAITEAIRGLLKRQERKPGVSIPSVNADPSGSL
jgi:metal-responsive CopG/Arc/MetJ family transcriptional regulator